MKKLLSILLGGGVGGGLGYSLSDDNKLMSTLLGAGLGSAGGLGLTKVMAKKGKAPGFKHADPDMGFADDFAGSNASNFDDFVNSFKQKYPTNQQKPIENLLNPLDRDKKWFERYNEMFPSETFKQVRGRNNISDRVSWLDDYVRAEDELNLMRGRKK
jgi:hypothetical protein